MPMLLNGDIVVKKYINKDKKKQFLIGLEKLTRETGIIIDGCGCCGSPYLIEVNALPEDAGYGKIGVSEVGWITPHDRFNWQLYSKNIMSKNEVD